jgi:hypothetical protein
MEKDTDIVKSDQTMMNAGWVMLILSFICSDWNHYGGDNLLLQFISAAGPWMMLGVGVACIAASISNKRKD